MDRHLLAYLMIAALVAVLAVIIVKVRHNSRDAVLKRRKETDEAQWAAHARDLDAAESPPERA